MVTLSTNKRKEIPGASRIICRIDVSAHTFSDASVIDQVQEPPSGWKETSKMIRSLCPHSPILASVLSAKLSAIYIALQHLSSCSIFNDILLISTSKSE